MRAFAADSGRRLWQARVKQLFVRWREVGWEEYRASLPETLAGVRSGDEAKDGLAAGY